LLARFWTRKAQKRGGKPIQFTAGPVEIAPTTEKVSPRKSDERLVGRRRRKPGETRIEPNNLGIEMGWGLGNTSQISIHRLEQQ
jgi:hypothetical protein